MRKLYLATILGASVAIATGCDSLKQFLTTPSSDKPGTPSTQSTPVPTVDLQGQLQQAAGFSSNLQQAAGFGVVLNGPTSQLQQAAGLGTPGAVPYRISSAEGISVVMGQPFQGEIGTGDLVASGSITATATQSLNNQEFPSAFAFDLEVATASKVPSLEGWKITGNLAATVNSSTQGLSGSLTLASGSVSIPVDFTFTLAGNSGVKWILTSPVTIDGVQHYSHLEVDPATGNGNGWIAKDKNGSTDKRVASCVSTGGKWTVKLLANPDATSSISMPWGN